MFVLFMLWKRASDPQEFSIFFVAVVLLFFVNLVYSKDHYFVLDYSFFSGMTLAVCFFVFYIGNQQIKNLSPWEKYW
jgi:hypothetical protein